MAVIEGRGTGVGDDDPRRVTPLGERSQSLHHFTGRLLEVLDDLTAGGLAVRGLSAQETAESVVEVSEAIDRLQGVLMGLLGHGETVEVAELSGATSTGAWFAYATRTPHGRAHRQVGLARRLRAQRHRTAEALLDGQIDLEQADVIVGAVEALPATIGPDERERAEKHLIAEAGVHDARKLKALGRHLLAVVDPEAADQALAARLEAEERRAQARTHLSMWDDGEGTCHGVFRIPSLEGAMLLKAVQALASPARPDAIARDEVTECEDGQVLVRPRLSAEILGEAFCHYIQRFPAESVPTSGGLSATVIVTMQLDTLLQGLGSAQLDTGQPISAAQARRMACQAGIIPAVLGGRSRVLDLGRKHRFYSEAQRLALHLQQGGCTAEGCDRPGSWCHSHHDLAWSEGGPTDLSNGRLLCSRHHTLAHHPGYERTTLPDGRLRLSRISPRRH